MKGFADDNFSFYENGRKFSKYVEILGEKEKLLVMSNFSFFPRVFKRLVLQTRKNQGLFGKGLTAKVISWRSETHMCFLAFLTPVLTDSFIFQSYRLLFSHER